MTSEQAAVYERDIRNIASIVFVSKAWERGIFTEQEKRALLAGADALARIPVLEETLRQAANDLRELAALLEDEGHFLWFKETEMKVAAIDKLLEGGK